MAVYRAPSLVDNACLPFVITGPKPDLILRSRDRLFVWGTPIELMTSLQAALKLPLIHLTDGTLAVAERDLGALRAKAKQVRQSINGDGLPSTAGADDGGNHIGKDSEKLDGSQQQRGNDSGEPGESSEVKSRGLSRGSSLFKDLSSKVIKVLSLKKRAKFVVPDDRGRDMGSRKSSNGRDSSSDMDMDK
jgi:hypothetical protein